jgi:hypothetical protein
VRPALQEEPAVTLDIEHWLAPTGTLLTALGFVMYALNRLVMHGLFLFRLRFAGVERLLTRANPHCAQPCHLS